MPVEWEALQARESPEYQPEMPGRGLTKYRNLEPKSEEKP